MKLKKITIQNYRSIEYLELPIEEVEGSYTYSLLGVNESGKSSILNAMVLFQNETPTYPDDYNNDEKAIVIKFHYEPAENETKKLHTHLLKEFSFPKEIVNNVLVKSVDLEIIHEPVASGEVNYSESVCFKQNIFEEYKHIGKQVAKIDKVDLDFEDPFILNLEEFFSKNLATYFSDDCHGIVFGNQVPNFFS